jgi:3-dehydroquinate synthase
MKTAGAVIRQALIPAAGRGARLDRPGTPKPLVDVGGEPLIIRLLGQLEAVGVERAVVVVGYDADRVVRRLSNHPRIGVELELIEAPAWEEGLARSLLAARDHIDGPFLLAMGDHLFDADLVRKMSRPAPSEGRVSALVETELARVHDLPAAVKIQLDGRSISRIGRRLEAPGAIDAGLFAAWPNLFEALATAHHADSRSDLSEAVQLLADQGLVEAVTTDGRLWADVDTPAALVQTEMRLRRDRRTAVAERAPRPAGAAGGARYRFVTGEPEETEVLVGRGFATDPEQLAVQIPVESGTSPLFVFTDQTVGRLYGDRFMAALEARGYRAHRVDMPDGEEAKSLASYSRLVEEVLARGIDESSVLISLGGGVVCNVCGFIASTLYRGIGLIHVPTTLMAQCDAAISHKQAINGLRGKNLVGSYYPPQQIVVDVDFLPTLEQRRIPDGLSEIIKHGLGQDASLHQQLMAYDGDHRDLDFLEAIVKRTIELKCEVMASDPQEKNAGMVLQYGHNIGHAVEWLSSYELSHGEAVAIGMMVAARVSRILGGCDDSVVEAHAEVLARYNLPRDVPADIAPQTVIDAMRYDKRYLTEGVRMALVHELGTLWTVDGDAVIPVSDTVILEALAASQGSGR